MEWSFPIVWNCSARRFLLRSTIKRVALEAEGRHLYNLSVGTPDFAPADHLKQALIDAAQDNENWKYSLRIFPRC